MPVFDDIIVILSSQLQLGPRAGQFTPSTPLLGNLPEFDSMAVVTVIGAIEERFDIEVADDEISADIFETVGSLCRFVESKQSS